MKRDLERSIREASEAMDRLLLAFERRMEILGPSQSGAEELERLTKGTHAIRDTGNIYLTWARHYASLLGQGTQEDIKDLEDFLDEGSGVTDNPIF